LPQHCLPGEWVDNFQKYQLAFSLLSLESALRLSTFDFSYYLTKDTISQTDLLDPTIRKHLSVRCFPILFKIGVAFRTESVPAVMAKATLQWLVTRPVQLTEILLEEGTAISCKLIGSNGSLAPFERRGKHAEGQLRRDLEHHAVTVPGFDRGGSLSDGPPAGADTIAEADFATARLGGQIFLQ